MTIPNYQSIMLPLLNFAGDKNYSNFSKTALEYVSKIDNKIVLIDGEELSNLMIDHDVGVSLVASYEIKKVDSDYFIEE